MLFYFNKKSLLLVCNLSRPAQRMNHLGSLRKPNRRILQHLSAIARSSQSKRTFLTESYYCYEEWDKFILSDVVKKVGPISAFSNEISLRQIEKQLVTPLDMDLLAAKLVHVNNIQELEYMENNFINFRKTQAAIFVRDSMHYSFIRNYIDIDQADRVLMILKLKYKYGIFVDPYTANMLMNTFLNANDPIRAALTAHEIMLQENAENPLTLAAGLMSCLKCVEKMTSSVGDIVQEDQPEAEEKKKVLVYFLRKPYNDGHFDLKSVRQLCGKTIYFASKNSKMLDQILSESFQVYGLLLLKNYEKAMEIFEKLAEKSPKIANFLVDEFKAAVGELAKNQDQAKINENFIQKWNKLSSKLTPTSVDRLQVAQSLLDSVKKSQIDADISAQKTLFTRWTKEQEAELAAQIRNVTIDLKKKSILERLDELESQEERLTFFDRQTEIELTYAEKGFPDESPADIPIEPDQSVFDKRAERHFKPWPKYMNRPKPDPFEVKLKEINLESLRKIYLNNNTTTQNGSSANQQEKK